MDDHLRIRLGAEPMPLGLEMWAEFPEVINLAVEHDRNSAGFVKNRLMAGGEVDDAEAADPQSDPPLPEHALIVWPAMLEARTHALQLHVVGELGGLIMHDTGNAAHAHLGA